MKRNIAYRSVGIIVSLLCAGQALAAEAVPCEVIRWQPGRVYVIKARMHHATHVILPEPMSGEPVAGNPDLWDVKGQSTHVFIRPTNMENAEGGGTTVAVISTSNTSYDFEVRRVSKGADTCVQISKQSTLIAAGTDWRTAEERRVSALQTQLNTTQEQLASMRGVSDQRALEAIKEYRGKVFTGYKWKGGKGFIGKDVISDVWDDGRFTFIRVNQDNKGILQVTAKVDGKDELIDYDYDSSKKLYTLSGLYPELSLQYGKSKVSIQRGDEDAG